MILTPQTWTRAAVERHSLDMRQFIDFRQSTLPNGMHIIEAYSSSGLTFTLLPDRGLDIWSAHYKGIPLTWIAPGSPHPPDFGQTWLQQFNGGLLTTCGLSHVGPPEQDEITGEQRDIHGTYTRLRTENINTHGEWRDENTYQLSLSGTIYDSRLFGTQFKVERSIWQHMQTPVIGLSDSITNMGDQPLPFMLLYHVNLGFPIIQQGTQLLTPFEQVYPRDKAAQVGFENWSTYEVAQAGYPEQVFFHHLKQTQDGQTTALLSTPENRLALLFQWDSATLPYLTQWKNTRQGIYVCGVEPGNCIPEGQNAARENKRLVMLEPGQQVQTHVKLEILEGVERIQQEQAQISQLQRTGSPIPKVDLHDYSSSQE